jgi:hypothetical protein
LPPVPETLGLGFLDAPWCSVSPSVFWRPSKLGFHAPPWCSVSLGCFWQPSKLGFGAPHRGREAQAFWGTKPNPNPSWVAAPGVGGVTLTGSGVGVGVRGGGGGGGWGLGFRSAYQHPTPNPSPSGSGSGSGGYSAAETRAGLGLPFLFFLPPNAVKGAYLSASQCLSASSTTYSTPSGLRSFVARLPQPAQGSFCRLVAQALCTFSAARRPHLLACL